MHIEIFHGRDLDSACDIIVFVNGERFDSGAIDIVDIDPGRGYTAEDWTEMQEYDMSPERERSEAFRDAIAEGYSWASDSIYIED